MLVFLSLSSFSLQLIKRQTLVPRSPHRHIVYHLISQNKPSVIQTQSITVNVTENIYKICHQMHTVVSL